VVASSGGDDDDDDDDDDEFSMVGHGGQMWSWAAVVSAVSGGLACGTSPQTRADAVITSRGLLPTAHACHQPDVVKLCVVKQLGWAGTTAWCMPAIQEGCQDACGHVVLANIACGCDEL
jgi:hypothetical protein